MSCSIFVSVVASAFLLPASDPDRPRHEPRGPLRELAGDYLIGPGIGMVYSLKIAPEGQFEFESSSCLGDCDRNGGTAEWVDGHLVLKPRLIDLARIQLYLRNLVEGLLQSASSPASQDVLDSASNLIYFVREMPEFALGLLSDGTPTDFIPVRWGERLYLVPKDKGPDFCNSFNRGLLFRFPGSSFYLREGAEKDVEGFPSVPEEWKPMLLAKPLEGEVIKILGEGRATVDFGARSGAFKGMHLCIDSTYGWAEVVEVGPITCEIEVHQDEDWVRLNRKVRTRKDDPE